MGTPAAGQTPMKNEIAFDRKISTPILRSHFKSLVIMIIIVFGLHRSHAQNQRDPFDSTPNPPIELNLKSLIYDRITIDSIPRNILKKHGIHEIVMPHCSEILVNQNLASVRYFNPRILIFDKNGMIDNQFVVFDYRTNRKTFSNGGDNILFKTTSKGDSIHVKAALDTMQFGFWLKTNDTSIAHVNFSYKTGNHTIFEHHEIIFKRDVKLSLEDEGKCD